MKRKELAQIQRENELIMTEIMLLKDEVRSLKRQLADNTPHTQQTIKVELQRPYDGADLFFDY